MAEQELDPSSPSFFTWSQLSSPWNPLIPWSPWPVGYEYDKKKALSLKKMSVLCYSSPYFTVEWSMQAGKHHAPYLKNFLKKLITEIELNHGAVLDELYEQYAFYMTSLKDDNLVKRNSRVCKSISFLFPDGSFELPSCPDLRKLVIQLQCSLNMLEGDTGCSVWPSSLFLSEFILSFPELVYNKSCFEVGSGVGLVGICLAHVRASKLILSDGDLSTLMNMKLNLESNNLRVKTDTPERSSEGPNMVKCIHLPWESASEIELQDLKPDVVLGADIIYDPLCLPHLVRVLAILLNQKKSYSQKRNASGQGCLSDRKPILSRCYGPNHGNAVDKDDGLHGRVNGANQGNENANGDGRVNGANQVNGNANGDGFGACGGKRICDGISNFGSGEGPVAYIAFVIRNADTFNRFVSLVDQANIGITDLTETHKPVNLLPYMHSYDRSSVRLLVLKYK
ncbi:Protein FAM86A [Morella rubra]|uniref:Protein FAM86A n=1 Tax=Morella rubra TaxID=262757 RepID=A0A6A1UPF8_9ROSI|nr:Protein FAM86A [Morella rubra]